MNNWWYIVIGSAIVLLATIPLMIISYKKSKKDYRGYGYYYEIDDNWQGVLSLVIYIVFGITFILSLAFSLCFYFGAKEEYYRHIEKYNYVQQVIDNESDLANIGITETILEYNSWLEKARADKKVYGSWSWYKDMDLESLEYIGVGTTND